MYNEVLTINEKSYNDDGFASPWAPRLWKRSIGANYGISAVVSFFIVVLFTFVSDQCRHWFLMPLLLCGTIAGSDVVAWFRKELDVFEIKALVAVSFYLACFLGPMLNLTYYFYSVQFSPPDWRPWFGYMACFNFIGLVFYKVAQSTFFKYSRPTKKVWNIDPNRFTSILLPILVISLAASLVVRFFFGGLLRRGGEVQYAGGSGRYAAHVSWVVMLGDPLVMLTMMGLIYWISRKNLFKKRGILLVAFILCLTMIFQFLLVGLRGSRSTILSGVVVVAAMIHYRLRRFSLKSVLVGILLAFVFVYIYGFYKYLGPRGWAAFYSSEARKDMSYELGGASLMHIVIVHSKSDIQAFLLYRLVTSGDSYEPIYGMSYAMSVLTFIPRGIWKSKPFEVKTKAGTRLQGHSGMRMSHLVYGLAGEAMLNFRYYGIVPAFFVFGIITGWLRKKIATMEPSDSRLFLVPLMVLTFGLFVASDSGSMMFGLLRAGTLPFIVIFFASIKSRLFIGGYPEESY